MTGVGTGAADALTELDPTFVALTERLFARTLQPQWLSPERHQAVLLALDALVTQLDPARLRHRIETAAELLDHSQILTVLQLVSVAGLHSVSTGAPLLQDERELHEHQGTLSEEQRALKDAFESQGPRPRPMDAMYLSILRQDPDYFEAFRAWIDHPWQSEAWDHGTLHLVCIAIDVACTHLYESGFSRHVRAALACGVEAREIFEVVQLASVEGLRSVFSGASHLSAAVFTDGS